MSRAFFFSSPCLVVALLASGQPRAASGAPDEAISSWIRSRAEEYEAYLDAQASGLPPPPPDQLWRARPSALVLRDFVPPSSLAPLIRQVRPGVVNISTLNTQSTSGTEAVIGAHSLGSGFIISPDGYLVTNNHVVERAQEIKVKLADGREFLAEVIGRDPSTDLALLWLLGRIGELPFLYLGDSDKLEVGDWVIAIGNPFGLDHSVAQGIISAKERVIGVGEFDDFIQTDALINPGNSGGPLFNMKGEVIGVNTAIITRGQGIGFAVPINMVKDLLPNLRANGHLARGWLGVNIYEERVSAESALQKGAVVKEVYANSPAATAGIEQGDRVVAVNGRPVETYLQMLRSVSLLSPGVDVRFVLLRNGQTREVTVRLGERHSPEASPSTNAAANEALGVEVRDVTKELAATAGIEPMSGVLVSAVVSGSMAEQRGIRIGDLITEVNKRRVTDVRTYHAALERTAPGEATLLRIQRGDEARYLAVGPE